MCIFIFPLHPSSVSLHIPLREQGPTAPARHPLHILQMSWFRARYIKAVAPHSSAGKPRALGSHPLIRQHKNYPSHNSVLSYKKQKQGHLDGA